MKEQEIIIRPVTLEDTQALLAIYAPYVEKTAITFEYEVPAPEEFQERIRHTLKKYPYLAAVRREELLGYAYTGSFVGRSAYDWAAETTVYLKDSCTKQGIGKLLYTKLEQISLAQHITNLYACIGYPDPEDVYLTKNSVEFHAHMGYHMAGEFHKCGYKFGTWYDMVWMEKVIAGHPAVPEPVIPFPEISEDTLKTILTDS